MTKIEKEIAEWYKKSKKSPSLAQSIGKLGEEFGELCEAVAVLNTIWNFGGTDELQAVKEEAADCAIVLTRLLITLDASLQTEMRKKLKINQNRKPNRKDRGYETLKELAVHIKKFGNDTSKYKLAKLKADGLL